jgi:hypothetical protein
VEKRKKPSSIYNSLILARNLSSITPGSNRGQGGLNVKSFSRGECGKQFSGQIGSLTREIGERQRLEQDCLDHSLALNAWSEILFHQALERHLSSRL